MEKTEKGYKIENKNRNKQKKYRNDRFNQRQIELF